VVQICTTWSHFGGFGDQYSAFLHYISAFTHYISAITHQATSIRHVINRRHAASRVPGVARDESCFMLGDPPFINSFQVSVGTQRSALTDTGTA
jgi:hypothetical protein